MLLLQLLLLLPHILSTAHCGSWKASQTISSGFQFQCQRFAAALLLLPLLVAAEGEKGSGETRKLRKHDTAGTKERCGATRLSCINVAAACIFRVWCDCVGLDGTDRADPDASSHTDILFYSFGCYAYKSLSRERTNHAI